MSKRDNMKKFLQAGQKIEQRAAHLDPNQAQKSFLGKITLLGSAAAAVGGILATSLSFWTTGNSRSEAEKLHPWAEQTYTTTLVTKGGGFVSSFYDDEKEENGHDYINGIYNQWKAHESQYPDPARDTKGNLLPGQNTGFDVNGKPKSGQAQSTRVNEWKRISADPNEIKKLPPMWAIEFNKDATVAVNVETIEGQKLAAPIRNDAIQQAAKAELEARERDKNVQGSITRGVQATLDMY